MKKLAQLLRNLADRLEEFHTIYCFLCSEPVELIDTKWDGFRKKMPVHEVCDKVVMTNYGTCQNCQLFVCFQNHICSLHR